MGIINTIKKIWKQLPQWLRTIIPVILCLLVYDPAKTAFNKVYKPETPYEYLFRNINNLFIAGSRMMVDQMVKDQPDLSKEQGTIAAWVNTENTKKGTPLNLIISNKDFSPIISMNVYPNLLMTCDIIHEPYDRLGRQYHLKLEDLRTKPNKLGWFHFVFTWDLSKQATTLYINGKEKK
jgi:hypothetical protein